MIVIIPKPVPVTGKRSKYIKYQVYNLFPENALYELSNLIFRATHFTDEVTEAQS